MYTVITKVVANRVAKYIECATDEEAQDELSRLREEYPHAFVYPGAYLPDLFVDAQGAVSRVEPEGEVPAVVSARQAYEELIVQGLHDDEDPARSNVEQAIAQLPDPALRARVRNLWRRSATFDRELPELVMLWTQGLGKTLKDLDATFISAAKR